MQDIEKRLCRVCGEFEPVADFEISDEVCKWCDEVCKWCDVTVRSA